MTRQIIFTAFLFLFGIEVDFTQTRLPSREEVRQQTSERNKAIENYDRANPLTRNISSPNGRLTPTGKIPGSEIRKYVLAAQADTQVKVLSIVEGDKLLIDDGTNKTVVRIIGIDAPEKGQHQYEEAKRHLSDLVTGKKVVLVYSLNNVKDKEGYFLARVFVGIVDVGLNLLENGYAWHNEKDKFFFEKKDDEENKQAQVKAQTAKIGIWKNEKPQKPWEYREHKIKEIKEESVKH